jgi:hypothetical protein
MTLVIHLVGGTVRRSRVASVHLVMTVLLKLLNTARWSLVLARNLSTRLVTDRRKLNRSASLRVAGRRLSAVVGVLSVWWTRLGSGSTGSLFLSLAVVVFLLLASLPLLSDLLEFCSATRVSACKLREV